MYNNYLLNSWGLLLWHTWLHRHKGEVKQVRLHKKRTHGLENCTEVEQFRTKLTNVEGVYNMAPLILKIFLKHRHRCRKLCESGGAVRFTWHCTLYTMRAKCTKNVSNIRPQINQGRVHELYRSIIEGTRGTSRNNEFLHISLKSHWQAKWANNM